MKPYHTSEIPNRRKQTGSAGKRYLLTITFILLALCLFCTACTSGGSRADAPMKTVTDMQGRTEEIPADPQRVACIYSSAAHMMAMLEEADKIVAVPNGVKSDELMKQKIPGLASLSVPMQDNDLNVEELLDIGADLVIVKEDQIIAKGQEEKLEKAGIPWIVADYDSIEQLWQCVAFLGQVFGDEEKAEAFTAFGRETIDMTEERLAEAGVDISDTDSLPQVYHSVNEAIRTDETGGICEEIMAAAGLNDISASKSLARDGNKTYATIEEIYKWKPDAIVANESSVTSYILSDAKWAGLDAVKAKQVYTLPVGASRWCHPGSMEAHMGVLALAQRFYPESFEDFDLKTYTKDYYETYFGLDLDEKTIENILAGEGMRRSNDAERKQ